MIENTTIKQATTIICDVLNLRLKKYMTPPMANNANINLTIFDVNRITIDLSFQFASVSISFR